MGIRETSDAGAAGKVNHHNPAAGSPEESDGNIVPEKSANKGTAFPAEPMEGRTPAERNTDRNAANRIQNRIFASPGLARVRQRAEAEKSFRFCNLFHFLKADLLQVSFYQLKRSAAPGLDEKTWYDYEQTLGERLPELERELHVGSYRATPEQGDGVSPYYLL